ncbi:hypothetical protein jhhlp_005177 [Lomentospora prolificans]|uniref:Uncharacterized protein n=1 Tax=Lomentospora prolificans TaxID=41688 RepID=A0A2N3N720_9PEZI|nr:hypothetical protein jhhlp_005177 [Lomentospora prolificans]
MTATPDSKRRDTRPTKRKRDPAESERQTKARQKRMKNQNNETIGLLSSPKTPRTPKTPRGTEEPVENGATPSQGLVHRPTTASQFLKVEDLLGAGWAVSKPLGGRIEDIDPILSEDERYLILAYTTSIQVYTTADSLLIRRIPIDPPNSDSFAIVAVRLSSQNGSHVWVACSDGRLWLIDWTTGSVLREPVVTKSHTAVDMVLLSLKLGKNNRELPVVSEHTKDGRNTLVVYNYQSTDESKTSNVLAALSHSGQQIHSLVSVNESRAIFAASKSTLIVGVASGKFSSFSDISYTFYNFETNDIITSLDARVSTMPLYQGRRAMAEKAKSTRNPNTPIIDVIVGGARGPIYFYNDLIAKLEALDNEDLGSDALLARKYHWHRRAVHTLKWSRDGNYMISGGSEHTLVIWQMDTGKMNFLPHLAGVVENLVVSETGSSYLVHLDDNSVMVLSTAELEPTVYVSGIQSATRNPRAPKDQWVHRAWTPGDVPSWIPAALHPEIPDRLYLCVGGGNQATLTGETVSAPFLQTVDLESFRSISKQAIARTHPSDANFTSQGEAVTDPRVTHLAFSHDGRWLATIDEWRPFQKDGLILSEDQERTLTRDKREIHLKFWEAGQGSEHADTFGLVSRINSPHVTSSPEEIFGLAADPTSSRFATVGNDGLARIWRPKVRQQDGITVTKDNGDTLHTWSCIQTVPLGNQLAVESVGAAPVEKNQGCIAFSEDGSTLFVAYGSAEDGNVYVIDARSGDVKAVLDGLWHGTLRSLHVLSPYIVILSDTLQVYDVVADDLCYGMPLSVTCTDSGAEGAIHLGVDFKTRHFALTVPVATGTEICVFSPDTPVPVLLKKISGRVVSLVTSLHSSGFIVLDDQAQLRTIAEGSDADALAVAKPLEEMRLDNVEAEPNGDANPLALSEMFGDLSDDEGEDEDNGNRMDLDSDDEAAHPAVVNQPRLAAIFDAAPAFAMPAIEDVFYQVAGLLATKKTEATSA